MIYSVGCEYGIRALARLASLAPTGCFCLLRDILDGDQLPSHFVGKIFQVLVHEGVLMSAKGRGGGFALRQPPEQITLRRIVNAIDGPDRTPHCFLGLTECHERELSPSPCRCAEIREQFDELLDTTTLAHLASHVERETVGKNVINR